MQQQQQQLVEASDSAQLCVEEELLLQQVQTTLARQFSGACEPVLLESPTQTNQQQQQQQGLGPQQLCSPAAGHPHKLDRAAAPCPAAAHAAQQEPTAAPDGDLLYFFKRIFSMPPFPGEVRPESAFPCKPAA
jgi:hypothetical protein